MALQPCTPALASLLFLVVSLAGPVLCDEDCDDYTDSSGWWHREQSCYFGFCCGSCNNRYCCTSASNRLTKSAQELCGMTFPGTWPIVAVGITIFVVFVVTIILCLTCSCCCLYKMCRKPRPVVTATTTTMIHTPYPVQSGVPTAYPVAPYQGYQPIHPSPAYLGPMPTAPYPTQHPPPYAPQPTGPPGYQETMATGAGVPYPAAQPPYNPAYVDSAKSAY
ncbi:protein shisa-5 isoform X2 [Rhinatrema bivittatum]|uniref:protein shisa-5 isoform X2 n=1 Tax=Rhinatrema bivittatum TaxID=194408 RepID=UPI00112C98DE|nr:protein shisa-5 isoform X2 [Rhinatrema bivittatum]